MPASAPQDSEKPADVSSDAAPTTSVDVSDEMTAAPRQPPLEATDASAIPLPEIVHGIDPADDASMDSDSHAMRNSHHAPSVRRAHSAALPPPVSDMFSNISARVQRVVRLANAPAPPPPPPGLVLFGDSLTERSQSASDAATAPGWAALLREVYEDNVHVFVRGFSGYNSRWALYIFPRVLRSCLRAGATVVAVAILLGTNDSALPSSYQHVPVGEYAENLTKLVRFVRSLNIVPILMTPPPASDPDRPPEILANYADVCKSVAQSTESPCIDLHSGFLARAGPDGLDAMFVDGVHFSTEGNRTLFDLVIAALPNIVPQLDPASATRPFPRYDNINTDDLAESLGVSELVES